MATAPPLLTWQGSLFDSGVHAEPSIDASFAGIRRIALDESAWVDHLHANLYRDGRDSVAWHGDRIARTVHDPHVAIVSLGEPRKLLLRPRGGSTQHTFRLGRGDCW